VADGVSKNTYNLITTPAQHAMLRTYDQYSGGYVVVDKNKNVRMYSADDTTVDAITIGTMSVGIQTSGNDGNPAFTPIMIDDRYPREWNNKPAGFKPDWNILGKNGLLPARLVESGTSNATTIVVNITNYETGAAISGLEVGTDYIFLTAAGVVQTITTAVESGTVLGEYTLTGTGLETGTLTLADPADLGITGYKAAVTITITIA